MKSTNINKYVKKISPVSVLMGGVGLLTGVLAIKEVVKLLSLSDEQKKEKEIDKAIKEEQNNGNPLTYPLAQYNVMADIIEQATDTSGTDTDAIYNVFAQLSNNTDMLQLIKAYGDRWNFMFGVPLGEFTLQQIINSELNSGEKVTLNQIIQGKGITIQF
ncbi:MAG: hypothetical protein QM503_06575 [Bacteroidota bacterium]